MEKTKWLCERIEEKRAEYCRISNEIWNNPEGGFCEFRSTEILKNELLKNGFTVTDGLAGMKTAFQGIFGSGRPVIGIIGEFDALANMSQEGNLTREKPVKPGGYGHGCGHNPLGTAALAAAVSVKDYLKENRLEGTVIYFGCPAEETGCGKSFMTRDGIFKDVDVALTWHPSDANVVVGTSNLASVKVQYDFKGQSSHAAKNPDKGRSALDAAELMNTGVQYLREHIVPEARVHYAFLNAGGTAPNVVQSEASLLYYVRASKADQALEILNRVSDVARGAALMTSTSVNIKIKSGLLDFVPNRVLGGVLHDAWSEVGELTYSDEAKEINRRFSEVVGDGIKEKEMSGAVPDNYRHCPDVHKPVSNDLGDVSYVVPVGKIQCCCFVKGTLGHSWQLTAQGCTAIAWDGMMQAGKVLAVAAVKLIDNPFLVREANEELVKTTGKEYVCLLPEGSRPNQ